MKKAGATSILFLISLGVFAILIVSGRPITLFKEHKSDQFNLEVEAAFEGLPVSLEKSQNEDGDKYSHVHDSLRPICGVSSWSESNTQCDIVPLMDNLFFCYAHKRIVEKYRIEDKVNWVKYY